MRRPTIVKKSGPYKVQSCADGSLTVVPTWPQFGTYTPENGGGPGVFSRLWLAGDLARWLNAPFKEPDVS